MRCYSGTLGSDATLTQKHPRFDPFDTTKVSLRYLVKLFIIIRNRFNVYYAETNSIHLLQINSNISTKTLDRCAVTSVGIHEPNFTHANIEQ